VGVYYLRYVNSRRSSSGVAYMFYTTHTRFLQTSSKPELTVNQYYLFEKQNDILYIFLFLKEVDMSPSVGTGKAFLFEGVAVLNMVRSLKLPIAYFYQQYNFSF